MNYKEWLAINYESRQTANKYYRAVYCDRVNDLFIKVTDSTIPLYEISDSELLERYVKLLLSNPIFVEFNLKGHRMYSTGLKAFMKYRDSICNRDFLTEDYEEIQQTQSITATEKIALCRARVGQGDYRRSLLKRWSGCAVTGYVDERLLIASHIKPWRLSTNIERLDVENGLILTPNLDKAFDKGLITFAPNDGHIVISNYLKRPHILGITPDLKLRSLSTGLVKYLEFHGERIFFNNAGE